MLTFAEFARLAEDDERLSRTSGYAQGWCGFPLVCRDEDTGLQAAHAAGWAEGQAARAAALAACNP